MKNRALPTILAILLAFSLLTACGPGDWITVTPAPVLEIQVEKYLEELPPTPTVNEINNKVEGTACSMFRNLEKIRVEKEGAESIILLKDDGSIEVDGQNFSASNNWKISCGGQTFVLKKTATSEILKGLNYWSLWIISE